MNWYIAKVVYRIICGEGNHPAQFEDQLRLVSAGDEEAAVAKAHDIATNEQFSFVNNRQQQVEWRFVNVSELIKVSEWVDGAELYSTINEVDNAEAYINLVNDKSALLLKTQTRRILNLI